MTTRGTILTACLIPALGLIACQQKPQPTGTTSPPTQATVAVATPPAAPPAATTPTAPAGDSDPAPAGPPAAPKPPAGVPEGVAIDRPGLPGGKMMLGAAANPVDPRAQPAPGPGAGVVPIPSEGGWFTLVGQVVFAGDKVPEKKKLNVDKDQDHCLSQGDLFAETWVVNPENKGIANCVVFLRPEKAKPFNVHDSLKLPAAKHVVLDQPTCYFSPRILVMRADQELLVKNPAPVAHNVVLTSFNNNHNVQMPPNSERSFKVLPENNAINVTCGAHPWMKGSLWVFEHPYFAITDADGRFKIPLVPGGQHNLMIWHEEVGWVLGRQGKDFPISAGDASGVTDLGTFPVKPG
ncbi:MAG TPA: hypothetical protein PKD86_02195 [Gemmatales bacterium]|nr:hypothetical protein [Gemmatales bacterium]HMP58140.1 hypothetical protein [Gemmatales bacterium]